MTCRSRRCSATRSRPSGAGRAGAMCSRRRWWWRRSPRSPILLSYDRRIAAIFVGAAAAVFVALQLVALLLMAIARRLPHARVDGAAARDRQHPPAGRADADHRAVARAWPRAAGHRDPDRRQSAPAVRRRAAGQGAVVLLRRHPVGRRRALRRLHPQARAGRDARTRADAARPHRVGERHQGRRPQGAAAAPPGCCRATAASPIAADVPRGSRVVEGNGGRRTITGRRWSRSRRRSPTASASRSAIRSTVNVLGRNITARIANLRTVRLAEPRHQLRAGVFAERLRRRAAHPYRHADLSGRRHGRSRRPRC